MTDPAPRPGAPGPPGGSPIPVTAQGCACQNGWQADGGTCESYCCNPDGDSGGDWCLVADEDCRGAIRDETDRAAWGYCAPAGKPPPPAPHPPIRDPQTGKPERPTGPGGLSAMGELGKVDALAHDFVTVHLTGRFYTNPVVFGGVPTEHGGDEVVVRIAGLRYKTRGCDGWCFDVRLQAPSCEAERMPGTKKVRSPCTKTG